MNKEQFKLHLKKNNQLKVFVILFNKLNISFRDFKKDNEKITSWGVANSLLHEAQYNKPLTKQQRRILYDFVVYNQLVRNLYCDYEGNSIFMKRCINMYLQFDEHNREILREIIDAELIEESISWLADEYHYLQELS